MRQSVPGERRRAYVSVFAWQADDGVVRLYPGRRAETFPVDAGGMLELPGLGEPACGVAPLPGEAASHEALIVLAGAAPYDPDRLAPPALGSAEASLRAAASADAFFDALAALDLAAFDLAVVPYRVASGPDCGKTALRRP